jgi:hypothetical protein
MDLKNPRLIKLKGALFLFLTVLASALLLMRTPEISSVFLLVIALWAACRAYYFAFYVLHHYVDASFNYSGIGSLIRYLLPFKGTVKIDPEAAPGSETKPRDRI